MKYLNEINSTYNQLKKILYQEDEINGIALYKNTIKCHQFLYKNEKQINYRIDRLKTSIYTLQSEICHSFTSSIDRKNINLKLNSINALLSFETFQKIEVWFLLFYFIRNPQVENLKSFWEMWEYETNFILNLFRDNVVYKKWVKDSLKDLCDWMTLMADKYDFI